MAQLELEDPRPTFWTLLYYCYADVGDEPDDDSSSSSAAAAGDAAAGADPTRSRAALARFFRASAARHGLVGRVRVARDGANATLGAAARAPLEAHAAEVAARLRGFERTDFKFAPSFGARSEAAVAGCRFDAFEAKIVDEIVTLGAPRGVGDPRHAGEHLAPRDFHAALLRAGALAAERAARAAAARGGGGGSGGEVAAPGAAAAAAGAADSGGTAPGTPLDAAAAAVAAPAAAEAPAETVLIDVRNAYESEIGRFEPPPGVRLLRPPVRTFAEFPAYFESVRHELAGREVLMYCTGGVRCERASALLVEAGGPRSVRQLAGGVQRYLEAAEAGLLGGEAASEGGAAPKGEAAREGGEDGARDASGGSGSASLWAGRLFVFDERRPVRVAGCGPAPGYAPSARVLGRCVRCAAPHDEYAWLRCGRCSVLVLLCDACEAAGAGAPGAAAAALRCGACGAAAEAEAGAAAARAAAAEAAHRAHWASVLEARRARGRERRQRLAERRQIAGGRGVGEVEAREDAACDG
jgi:predicted sulfurtransferase